MAVSTSSTTAAFGSFHLDPAAFDALLVRSGSPADLRIATRCACYDPRSGSPDPACTLCFPFGVVWGPVTSLKVFGPNRKPTRRQDAAGTYDASDAFFTFPTGVIPTRGSRLTLPLSVITVDDLLVKGDRDTIRYPNVVAIEAAFYTTRNPPTGSPYTVVQHPLVLGTDIAISGRTVTWINGAVPNGTPYRVRFTALAEYLVWEDQDRNEGGRALPYRCLCKRVDYLLHPRDDKATSYG